MISVSSKAVDTLLWTREQLSHSIVGFGLITLGMSFFITLSDSPLVLVGAVISCTLLSLSVILYFCTVLLTYVVERLLKSEVSKLRQQLGDDSG